MECDTCLKLVAPLEISTLNLALFKAQVSWPHDFRFLWFQDHRTLIHILWAYILNFKIQCDTPVSTNVTVPVTQRDTQNALILDIFWPKLLCVDPLQFKLFCLYLLLFQSLRKVSSLMFPIMTCLSMYVFLRIWDLLVLSYPLNDLLDCLIPPPPRRRRSLVRSDGPRSSLPNHNHGNLPTASCAAASTDLLTCVASTPRLQRKYCKT